jgi:LysM repeat protein
VPPSGEERYVVVRGDVLEFIAGRFDVPLARIAERNNLRPPYTLQVGQVLIIPDEP